MSRTLTRGALALAVLLGAATADAAEPNPGVKPDYRFSVQPTKMKVGTPSTLTVQVLLPDKATIANAKIVATRLDMGPDGMAEMTAPIKPVSSDGAAGQAFSATLPMAGRWAVSLEAKVPGEAGPVRGQVVLEAK